MCPLGMNMRVQVAGTDGTEGAVGVLVVGLGQQGGYFGVVEWEEERRALCGEEGTELVVVESAAAIHSGAYSPCVEENMVLRLQVWEDPMNCAVEQAAEIGTRCNAEGSTDTAARKEERGPEQAEEGMGRHIVQDSSLTSQWDELDRTYGHPLGYRVMTHS